MSKLRHELMELTKSALSGSPLAARANALAEPEEPEDFSFNDQEMINKLFMGLSPSKQREVWSKIHGRLLVPGRSL
jgi:hypothetical protein